MFFFVDTVAFGPDEMQFSRVYEFTQIKWIAAAAVGLVWSAGLIVGLVGRRTTIAFTAVDVVGLALIV